MNVAFQQDVSFCSMLPKYLSNIGNPGRSLETTKLPIESPSATPLRHPFSPPSLHHIALNDLVQLRFAMYLDSIFTIIRKSNLVLCESGVSGGLMYPFCLSNFPWCCHFDHILFCTKTYDSWKYAISLGSTGVELPKQDIPTVALQLSRYRDHLQPQSSSLHWQLLLIQSLTNLPLTMSYV